MNGQVKKPYLLYWEDAEDCFCVANEQDFPNLVFEMLSRGLTSERLSFYYVDTPDEKNKMVYDVGSKTLSMINGSLENYIPLDYFSEDDDIELEVKVVFLTDSEYAATPEI